METCDPIGTPMEIKDKLDLDQNGTLVDATKYRSMIGALMYLTSSRSDIVHATYLCAWYQAQPIEKHLKEVKRIFRYLWGTVNMGLCQNWRDLPRDTPLDRVEVIRLELVPLSLLVSGDVILSIVRSSTKHNLVSPSCDFFIL
ncbi:retrovirus-related pol polyprotein from transposon TNT 1-94 [Tanacetum coccineum]